MILNSGPPQQKKNEFCYAKTGLKHLAGAYKDPCECPSSFIFKESLRRLVPALIDIDPTTFSIIPRIHHDIVMRRANLMLFKVAREGELIDKNMINTSNLYLKNSM